MRSDNRVRLTRFDETDTSILLIDSRLSFFRTGVNIGL